MEKTEYSEMLSKTTDHKEMIALLKGYDRNMFPSSQYAAWAPVDTGTVLSKVVYPAYNMNSHVKEEMEQVLYEMLSQTDYDVYIVTLYVMSELFREKYNLAPFKMDTAKILSGLKLEMSRRENSIQQGIRYPNGFKKISAWDELNRLKNVCKKEYDIALF